LKTSAHIGIVYYIMIVCIKSICDNQRCFFIIYSYAIIMYPQLVDVSKSYITISDIKQILPVSNNTI